MNPERGQLVQIRFNNGVFFDAIVEEWSDQKSVVKLANGGDTVIIQKTLQDVLLVKIMQPTNKEQSQKQLEKLEPNVFVSKTRAHIPYSAYEEFEHLKNNDITNHSLNRMAELKDEMNELERQEVFGNMQTFKPNGAREVNYGLPRNISISSIAQHSDQETPSADPEFNSELQNLFDQEY